MFAQEVIKLVQYAREYQTELAKQKLLKIIKERDNKMSKTKFVAKKYFDYHLERKVVFDNKDECEKFIDEQNKKLEHSPYTWWEGYIEEIAE